MKKQEQDAAQDPTMDCIRSRFEESGLTLHDLGVKMGYPEETARKSAWQFISKTSDPRLSMLRRFAGAMNLPVMDLIEVNKRRQRG